MKNRFKQENGAVRCPLKKTACCRVERGADSEMLVAGDWLLERHGHGGAPGRRTRALGQFLAPGTEKVAEHRGSGIGGGPSFLLG